MKSHPLTNVRVVKIRNGHISGGDYTPAVWAVLFERNCSSYRVDVRGGTGRTGRPTGQDVLDAMRQYIRRKETTEADLLDAPVVE